MGGESWSITDQLLALISDQLAAANWQRGGGKGARPKPLPRPGVKDGTSIGGNKSLPLVELKAWAARRKGGVTHG